jgi:hypothetical protein
MSQFSLRPSGVIGIPIMPMKFLGMPISGGWKNPGCAKRGQTIFFAAACPRRNSPPGAKRVQP